MKKIIKKVTSRKFLLACIVFITMIMIAAGADVATVKSVVAIIVAGVNCAIYIAGEAAIEQAGRETMEDLMEGLLDLTPDSPWIQGKMRS